MPQVVKSSALHILISIIVAPIAVTLFAWLGNSVIDNREANILLPTVTKKLDEIQVMQHEQAKKQDNLLVTVYQNKQDIAVIKSMIQKEK